MSKKENDDLENWKTLIDSRVLSPQERIKEKEALHKARETRRNNSSNKKSL
ncbi:hypothetical protein [Maribacter algarum]|uniref:hypothetical protein n=1 Tax=Maribacter algarum (ex Zhang et al. 2020) TaxID=2578118 RepID=UPI001485FE88|nr:hypothetical protein [Maribacter algarum]